MTLDITKAATWKSSSTKVAKVSNAKTDRGLATGSQKRQGDHHRNPEQEIGHRHVDRVGMNGS